MWLLNYKIFSDSMLAREQTLLKKNLFYYYYFFYFTIFYWFCHTEQTLVFRMVILAATDRLWTYVIPNNPGIWQHYIIIYL